MSESTGNSDPTKIFLPLLLHEVERRFNISPRTPSHFEELAEKISAKAGQSLSLSTVKRLWGYVDRGRRPHQSTLNVLAHSIGYADFTEFCANAGMDASLDSSHFIATPSVDADALTPGQKLIISWLPDRELRIRYIEGQSYEIEESVNSKLRPGYMVTCVIIPGEPLTLRVTDPATGNTGTYVCGTNGGITYRPA